MLKIVHAVPDWGWRKSIPGHGAWKDITGRMKLWEEMGLDVEIVDLEVERPDSLLDHLTDGVTDLVFEYTHWPELLEQARRFRPRLRIHVRAHNAESLVAWRKLRRPWPGSRPGAKLLQTVARTVWQDVRVLAAADTLLGVSEWDNRNYWRRLPRRAEVLAAPYFCPWTGIGFPTTLPLWSERRKAVACMPAARSPIDSAQIEAFFSFTKAAARSPLGGNVEFLLTNALARENPDVDVPAEVAALGDVGNPFRFLQQVRAVAVLAHQGFGTKTTVFDAIEGGCHVIVGSDLAARLPQEVRARCLVVDSQEDREVSRALEALELPPPPSNLNWRLKERTKRVLQSCLGLPVSGPGSVDDGVGRDRPVRGWPSVEMARVVEPGLGITTYPSRTMGMLAAAHPPWTKGGASVLMYHGIVRPKRDDLLDRYAIDEETFRSHLRFLKRRRSPVELSTLVQCLASGAEPDPRWVVVTLDDGLRSQVTRGAEILDDAGIAWTLCVPMGLVGTRRTLWSYALALLVLECWKRRRIGLPGGGSLPVSGRRSREHALREIRDLLQPSPQGLDPGEYVDERISEFGQKAFEARLEEDGRFAMANWEEVRALDAQGVGVVAHGFDHLPEHEGMEELIRRQETAGARSKAEKELGRCVGFALPHGVSASWTHQWLSDAGFEFGLTSRPAPVVRGTDVMDIPRIQADISLEALEQALTSVL